LRTDVVLALEDLERIRHVVGARHAGQVALDLGIGSEPVLLVVLLLLERGGQVRNRVALDHTQAGGHRADRAHLDDFRRRHRHELARHHGERGPRGVRLEIVIRGVQRLPDAIQVGLAVLGARPLGRGRCSGSQCASGESCGRSQQ
jgi:hypothetical protein